MFCDKSINKNIVDIVFKQIHKKKKKISTKIDQIILKLYIFQHSFWYSYLKNFMTQINVQTIQINYQNNKTGMHMKV